MKSLTIEVISVFIDLFYKDVDGVILFGSAIKENSIPEDIDLVILDYKFSYVSKSSYKYDNLLFNIIKIPFSDVFSILAQDFSDGIYKNIFEKGIIIRDNLKFLSIVNNFITEKYPSSSIVIRHNLSKLIPSINTSIDLFVSSNKSFLEEYLQLNELVSMILRYNVLINNELSLVANKHKGRYIIENDLKLAVKIESIVKDFSLDRIKAKHDLKILIESYNFPKDIYSCNDYTTELINFERITFLIKDSKPDIRLIKHIYISLTRKFPDCKKYFYYVDQNNVEENGLYFVFKFLKSYDEVMEIKSVIDMNYKDQVIYFPYNDFLFHPEIKFGSKKNLITFEKIFIKIQRKFLQDNSYECIIGIVLAILNISNLNERKCIDFYFFKTLNNSHNISYKEINQEFIIKENAYNAAVEGLIKKYKINELIKIKIYTFTPIEIKNLSEITDYMMIQFLDRVLSLNLSTDIEKQLCVFLAIKLRE